MVPPRESKWEWVPGVCPAPVPPSPRLDTTLQGCRGAWTPRGPALGFAPRPRGQLPLSERAQSCPSHRRPGRPPRATHRSGTPCTRASVSPGPKFKTNNKMKGTGDSRAGTGDVTRAPGHRPAWGTGQHRPPPSAVSGRLCALPSPEDTLPPVFQRRGRETGEKPQRERHAPGPRPGACHRGTGPGPDGTRGPSARRLVL